MGKTPRAGDGLSLEDVEMIIEAIGKRKENFPDEPGKMSIALVLMNIGDRFAPVECVGLEWKGLKSDIPKGESPMDLPKCPNGHVLTQGHGLKLGWLRDK